MYLKTIACVILQCTIVYVPHVQYTTAYLSILQYTTVYHSIPQYTTVLHSIPQYTTVYHNILGHIPANLSLHREEIDKKLEKLKTVERELTNKEQELQEVCVAGNYER